MFKPIRLLLKTLFYQQSSDSLAGFARNFQGKHQNAVCRESKGFTLCTSIFRDRVRDMRLPLSKMVGLYLLKELRREEIYEATFSLRAAGQLACTRRLHITTHGRRLWQKCLNESASFTRSQWAIWQRLNIQHKLCQSLLPPFSLVVRAVSLACTRSNLTLGFGAVMFGVLNQDIAEAQQIHGNTSFPGRFHQSVVSSPLYVISLFFSALEFIRLFSRAFYLLILFMPAVFSAPFADTMGAHFRELWLYAVRHSLELAGAAFIKWGQWAATRPDLFPRDLCLELSKLQSKAPTHKFSHTVRTVEGAFGRKLHEIFEEFEEEPIASGSIAQVHKATLRFSYPGKKAKSKPMVVAVKVRHPRVSDVIRRDFVIINWVARMSTLIPGLRPLRLDESVQQFAVFMLTQVDLAREATHLSRFLYNFRSWKDVSFPKPLYPLVHPAVLVETYEQGESVSRYVELPKKTPISSALAHIGTHTLLKMLLVDNFIHADMHPGNILVRVEKKKRRPGKPFFTSRPHMIFLDVGMTAELDKQDRTNLLNFFKAVAVRDGRAAAECALQFSQDQACPNPEGFIKEVESSFRLWGSEEGDDIHPGDCIQDLLEQVRKHQVNVDGNVCTVMVTTMIMEGWQRKLDPDYNLMKTLQTLMFKVDLAESLSYTLSGIVAP